MTVSPRERWLIGGAGLTVLVYLLFSYYAFPLWDSFKDSQEQISMDAKRIVSYRRILRGQDSSRAAMAMTQRNLSEVERGLLVSKSDALATAEIQGALKQLATSRGLEFRRSEVLPTRRVSAEYLKVSARVEVMGGIDQLVNFLTGMSSLERMLFVEELRIAPVQIGNPKNKSIVATIMVSAVKPPDSGSPPLNKSS
jgi:Tfp pilus assembly protein PilO